MKKVSGNKKTKHGNAWGLWLLMTKKRNITVEFKFRMKRSTVKIQQAETKKKQ